MDLDKRKLTEAEVDTLLEGLDEVAIVKESTMEEDEVTNLERIVEKSIGNKMLCPIKQATANHARECDRSKCAWYLDQENRCAILSAVLSIDNVAKELNNCLPLAWRDGE